MASKFEGKKLLIPREYNKRCKVTEEDIRSIYHFYELGCSIHAIARIFAPKLTRRMIQFILFPERYERIRLIRKSKGQKYYKREKHRDYMRKHRARKKNLWRKGLLRKRVKEDLKTMAKK